MKDSTFLLIIMIVKVLTMVGRLIFFIFKIEKAVLLIGMLISRDLGQLLLSLTSVSCGSSVTEIDAIPRFRCNPF